MHSPAKTNRMFNGLKGNNVKFAAKPPVPPKTKPTNCNTTNSKLQNSPYLSTVVPNQGSSAPRRSQSATNIRGPSNVVPSSQKPPVVRKQSEPAIKIPNKIATVKPKLFATVQKVRQRPQSSESDRSVTESFYSSNISSCNGNSSYKSKLKNPKGRPTTVPKDVRSNSPHEDVIKMMMMMGDVESFEDFIECDFDKSKSKNSTLPNKTRRPFSFSSDSYATVDFNTLSLDLDIAEQPEEFLKDHPSVDERGDGSRQGHEELSRIGRRKSLGDSNENSEDSNKNPFNFDREKEFFPIESPTDIEYQKNLTKSPRSFDRLILSQSEDLLHDVVKLCDEIGLDASVLEKIKNSSRFNPPDKTSSSLNDLQNLAKQQLNLEMEEDLENMSCPSTVRNRSALESSRPDDADNKGQSEDPNVPKSSTPVKISSRPISASSRRSSLGMDYSETYSKILSVLRHIEEEEKNALSKIDFTVQSPTTNSLPNSPQPFSSSRTEINTLSPTLHQRKCSEDDDNISEINQFSQPNFISISPRSCSCANEQCCQSARSQPNLNGNRKGIRFEENDFKLRPATSGDTGWETADEKTKNLFSFLDEVEKSDRATLFTLKFDQSPRLSGQQGGGNNLTSSSMIANSNSRSQAQLSAIPLQTMDTLIRKGSVELAREVIILERKLDETQHNINLLEESLVNQRELNIRNLKNSERDWRNRLKLEKEEREMAASRHKAFVEQLFSEKRSLQDKCEKVLRDAKEVEQRYQEQIRSLQEKQLEEIKRIRRVQQNSENVRKQKWVGNKTQEIRDMTVKGLEPEVQRIIQRHQQEMSEMRAWHTDELREAEDRYQRKHNMQLQELREQFIREKEEVSRREREMANKRLESELKQREEEFESQKRRIMNELNEERERYACDEIKLKDSMQENIRKAQIKGEVEIDNVRQEYEAKISNIDRRHENELKSLKDVYEAQKENWVSNHTKKFEQALADKESEVAEAIRLEKEREIREKEKKLRDEFDKLRREDEVAAEGRLKRLQDKFLGELAELEKSERDLKCRLSQAKADLLVKDEEIFTLKTTLNLKEKTNNELQDSNMRMLEERANLTSVIRREFVTQIESMEEDCRMVKSNVLELQAKQKLELEQHQMEIEKIRNEKDAELEKVGLRVKQALLRKEETLQELQKQLEKASYRINHLEELLEQQRKDFVQSISIGNGNSTSKRK